MSIDYEAPTSTPLFTPPTHAGGPTTHMMTTSGLHGPSTGGMPTHDGFAQGPTTSMMTTSGRHAPTTAGGMPTDDGFAQATSLATSHAFMAPTARG